VIEMALRLQVGRSWLRLALLATGIAVAGALVLTAGAGAGAGRAGGSCSLGTAKVVYSNFNTRVWAYGYGICSGNPSFVTVKLYENNVLVSRATFRGSCGKWAYGFAGPRTRISGARYNASESVQPDLSQC
jgi:hypothetical protein